MEDSELTRQAIDELMKEMDEYKEKESMPTERKKNPLGRPNKLFLGRTINSMMKHNKRQTDRNLQRCERKLKELDNRRTQEFRKNQKEQYVKFENSYDVSSDSSNDGLPTKKKRKIKKKKKKRKKKYRSRASSFSTNFSSTTDYSSSSNSSANSKNRNRKKKRHKNTAKDEECVQDFYTDYVNELALGYFMDPNAAYAVMACNQMNHMIQQQQEIVEKDLEESLEIPSDLNISYHSSPESSINISLHSSSAEEDENGVVTFKLSSDDEEKVVSVSQKVNEKSLRESNGSCILLGDDKESEHSHISLDSEKSNSKENDRVYVLDSSDSEELEIIEIVPQNVTNHTDIDRSINVDIA